MIMHDKVWSDTASRDSLENPVSQSHQIFLNKYMLWYLDFCFPKCWYGCISSQISMRVQVHLSQGNEQN